MEIEIALENEITRGDWRIYIEPNPDRYRGGFIWSIVKDDGIGNDGVCESDIWDDGLAWSKEDAVKAALDSIARCDPAFRLEQLQLNRGQFDLHN
ncbi:hypothetical protein [Shewanella sp.]|uniref:hypothetical protein n=1 Tax=Shewanella sp. TaxID=50422 RepID=UPI0035663EEF